MKRRILSIIVAVSMIFSMMIPAFAAGGDNTGDDIFGMAMYIKVNPTEGSYTLGENFSFKVTAYVGDLYGTTATRTVDISGVAEVTDFQYKRTSDVNWSDISKFNIKEVIKNEVDTEFQVKFNETGVYRICFKYESDELGTTSVIKYVTITEDSYVVTTTKPEEETTTVEPEVETTTLEESSSDDPETTTPEESSSDEPETSTPEESSSDEPETSTPEESSSDEPETSTPEESSSDDTTTVEPSTEALSTEAPTTEAPTTTLSPEEEAKLMKAPGKVTIKKATKKAKKLSLKFKKVQGATAYEVAVYTTKKLAKKNDTEKAIVYKDVAKVKVALKSKKIKKAKKLFVRVRAFVDVRGYKKVGKWSKVKKVK